MRSRIPRWLRFSALVLLVGCLWSGAGPSFEDRDADVVIVGAGIAGLSAAAELASAGHRVVVLDMASVFGGHAVSSHGGLSIIASPIQQAAGVADSPELAFSDFMKWGEDAEEPWVRSYVQDSRSQIYDWLVGLGVEFEDLRYMPGNSVLRFHNVKGRGLGLVSPIYRACLLAGVEFRWNTQVQHLVREGDRVVGVQAVGLRNGETLQLKAPAVVLATGGFQSNLELVEANWSKESPVPRRILAGSGWNSQGSGLALAEEVGAGFHRLDHQWNYVTGLPDPRYPGADRGLNVLHGQSIWINLEGLRFTNECAAAKETLPALLQQPSGSYWAVFDSQGKGTFQVSGSGWTEERIERLIFDNPELTKKAPTLEELAQLMDLPSSSFLQTVLDFNKMVDLQSDPEFGRFQGQVGISDQCLSIPRLEKPPFFALRMYPLARKSMGGIRIDEAARVRNESGEVIAGLFGAGEATGFAGINGKAGLEGTFLGPSIFTGRVAARTIHSELSSLGIRPSQATAKLEALPGGGGENSSCVECHDLANQTNGKRSGYWHFELVHRVVQEQNLSCDRCHSELFPYRAESHQVDPLARLENCRYCHGLQAID